ncbi:MAG: septum formation initiator family protein [bacterium]|nr:septum formation initiator family protein [bacterium]
MKEFQRKRTIRRVLYSRVSLLGALILVVLAGRATWGMYEKERESRRQFDRAQEELAALEAREKELTGRITRLDTPEGVEAEIREQFPVTKPGERMVVIVEEKEEVLQEVVFRRSLVAKFFDLFR